MPEFTPIESAGSATLTAVNRMLEVCGEAPVSSLSVDPSPGLIVKDRAQNVLTREVSTVLERGWACNTVDRTLTADSEEIDVDAMNIIGIAPVGSDNPEITLRGGKLYDTTNRTFTLDGTYTLKVFELLDFDDLPPLLARFITEKASATFYLTLNPDRITPDLINSLNVPVRSAEAQAIEEDGRLQRVGGDAAIDTHVNRVVRHLQRSLNEANLERRIREEMDDARLLVLEQKWSSNTENDRPFEPDGSGNISLSGILSFSPSYQEHRQSLSKRGGKLYDNDERTDVFTSTVYLDVVSDVAYADLPNPMQRLVADQAGYAVALASGSRGAIAAAAARLATSEANALRDSDDSDPESQANTAEAMMTRGRPSNRRVRHFY